MPKIHFSAERNGMDKAVALYMGVETDSGQLSAAQPVTFQEVENGLLVPEMLRLSMADAQILMDELYRVGLRPTDAADNAGALAATERHLADMRHLATKLLEKVVS